jgi:hypothetical protein
MLEWVSGTTPATNANGTYSTSSQTVNSSQHLITESEITTAEDGTGNMRFDLTADPWLSSAGGAGSVPTGTGRLHAYIMRGDLSTLSPMSNQLSFAISASIAKWTSTNGTKKSSNITLSGANLTTTGSTSVGTWYGIAATIDGATKSQWEFTVVANGTESNDQFAFGLYNGTTDLSGTRPGVSDSNGLIIQSSTAQATFNWFFAATAQSGTLTAGSNNAVGDIITLETDTSGAAGSHSFSVYRTRSGVTTQIGATVTGKTLTGFVRAFQMVQSNIQQTANFGGSTFAHTLNSGFSLYG